MDYKLKYEEALERAKNLHKDAIDVEESLLAKQCEIIFPELCKSEDEKIREVIIGLLKQSTYEDCDYDGVNMKDIYAWLENNKKSCNDNSNPNSTKPKFKVGDIVRKKDGDGLEWTILSAENNNCYKIANEDYDNVVFLDGTWEVVEQVPTLGKEDDAYKLFAISAVEDYYDEKNPLRKVLVDWLKSIEPQNTWKPADGDDLPELDREVIVLYQRYPLENCEYSVGFGHRPKEYWDGKNIETGEITRYYPKRYDKGGWNIPDVKYWLDCELPTKE